MIVPVWLVIALLLTTSVVGAAGTIWFTIGAVSRSVQGLTAWANFLLAVAVVFALASIACAMGAGALI